MFEALMKRIESIEKRNCELERRNRHFEYLQQANLSVYPYSGYPLSGLRAPPVNPPYFPVTPPYLTSPLAPHFVTRPPPEISTSCQSHMAPDLMTTTQREVDYSQQSCSESTTDFCTFSGSGSLPGLPEAQVMAMKAFLFKVCVPALGSKIEFEGFYKKCTESVGQACKNLRTQRLCGLELD